NLESYLCIALAGHANDHRTLGAYLINSTKGAKSLALGNAQGNMRIHHPSAKGAESTVSGNTPGLENLQVSAIRKGRLRRSLRRPHILSATLLPMLRSI
ncbi:hypothetical protein, partial [Lunatimonas lonarensis]|uniref:hypothetical protein n=1 Tax=Lunatimonas lonarensis TaxID=1232681 RepID=UPI00055FEF59